MKNTVVIIRFLAIILVLAMMIYGLVYAPTKQLKISEESLLLQFQVAQIAETRAVRMCEANAQQQLTVAVESAQENNQTVTEDEKRNFLETIFLNCITLEARDYLNQNQEEGKVVEENAVNNEEVVTE